MFKKKQSTADPKKLWETYLKASLKQDWEKAKDALQNIIKLDPKNSKTHLKMGDLLQKMGDTKGAIKAYHHSASLLIKTGFGHKALALYKIILRLDPRDEEAKKASEDLLESEAPVGAALPAFSPDESPPLKKTVQEAPPPAEEAALAGPSAAEVPATDTVPTPSEWPGKETPSADQMPETTEWPGEGGAPSAWPREEGAIPEPEPGDALAGLDLEVPEAKDEESIRGLYDNVEEPAQPEHQTELPALDVGAPTEAVGGQKEWSGPLPEIFWSLNKEELAQIASDSTLRTFSGGDIIVKEGDSGDSIYAIVEGHAKVTTTFGDRHVDLASLGAGDVFGEVAFLSGKPRTATVLAESNVKVMDISRSVLEKAIEKHPRILSCLAEYYHNRVKDTLSKVKRAKKPKTRFIIKD